MKNNKKIKRPYDKTKNGLSRKRPGGWSEQLRCGGHAGEL